MLSNQLTIVIPARDRADLLELCLRSVFECQKDAARVIVSDNSTVRLPGLEALRERYSFSYVRQSGKLRMVDHHNACLELVTTPWALLLHDDDELYPGVLSRLEPVLAGSATGLILGGTQFIDGEGKADGAWVPESALDIYGEAAVLRLGLDFTAYPPSCIWKMESFRQAGGFPDANGAGADYTLVLWLAHRFGVTLFPEFLGRYRVGPHQSTGYATPERAEATLDCSIKMAQLTRDIGVSREVADQLIDYMTWWIFRIVAASLLDTHPLFVARMRRKCERVTPPEGRWRSRVRSEYRFLFWRPDWLWMSAYRCARRALPGVLRRKLSGRVLPARNVVA